MKSKKSQKKKGISVDPYDDIGGGSASSMSSSRGSKKGKNLSKKANETLRATDEKYLKKIEIFFKLYRNKNDKLNIPEVLKKLDILEIEGCELIKQKLMRAKDINLKNKISPEIDLNEFTNYFFFDLNDELDYEFIFDKITSVELEPRCISYNNVVDINKKLRLSEKDLVLMFNHTDINNQQIPLDRLKDLITDWKKMEEKVIDIEKESNLKKIH